MHRGSGVLLHISSLPSPYGIGTFGHEAYKFADDLNRAGFTYWQMLPLTHTDYSPYMSNSLFAGNPYFVDLREFIDAGWLSKTDVDRDWGADNSRVDFDKLWQNRIEVLRLAFANAPSEIRKVADGFGDRNPRIAEYALFMALKQHFGGRPWWEWGKNIADFEEKAVTDFKTKLGGEIGFWLFVQYYFFKQFTELKKYANSKNIKLLGDFPFYASLDSADVWANRNLFRFSGLRPELVAGVPPDYFSETGQLWGNPVYDFNEFKKTGYRWIGERFLQAAELFDLVRIDHFRGLESFWAVPCGSETAADGKWMKGMPRTALKRILKETQCNCVGEDLGIITDKVVRYRDGLKLPGMNVLQFAFFENDNKYLPHNHAVNSVSYIGTHDNNTLKGWICNEAGAEELQRIREYLQFDGENFDVFFRCLLGSTSASVIFAVQDLLLLGGESRMNTPSTLGGNWAYRMTESLPEHVIEKFRRLNGLYGRCR